MLDLTNAVFVDVTLFHLGAVEVREAVLNFDDLCVLLGERQAIKAGSDAP